ncbi:hypothetical protein JA1_004254 [Spathaspora sp. JA1]|nr:hypothetical protein JA1_004254 [Spathaspora sp. JA1]
MKKYQLIGRRKFSFSPKRPIQYPLLHLCSLPLEILIQIFQNFSQDTKSLLILSLVCKRFHIIINKHFLYVTITFKKPSTFYKFSVSHLLHEPSSNINYLQKVELMNPQIRDSSKYKTRIAGSYAVESDNRTANQLNYNDFITSIKGLLGQAFGLKCLILSEISPEFIFPLETQSNTTGLRLLGKKKNIPKSKRTLNNLILRTQSGWSIPFKQGHLSLICEYFDTINQLHLVNFIIDDTKPMNIGEVQTNKLIIESCIYTNSFKKSGVKPQPNTLFNKVGILELRNILNDSGLSLIDLVKLNNSNLNHLIIDISSNIFYVENNEFNFKRFNRFFNLLCSGYGNFTNLTLTNFTLFQYLMHDEVDHKQDQDSWIEPSENNFETFMKFISQISNLRIMLRKNSSNVKTCIKCGFIEQQQDKDIDCLTSSEWEIFLKPLELNRDNSISIFNYKNNQLYSRSKM